MSGPHLAVMQRRAFLASLGLNVLAAPLAAGAQQTGKIPRIGILTTGFPDVLRHLLEAFKQGLQEHGYVEGHNVRLELRYAELDAAFRTMTRDHVEAFIVFPGQPTLFANRKQIVELAAKNRLPAMFPLADYVEAGGLISYRVNNREMFRRSATHVDKILKGAKPADLPVEQPTKFELVIKAKTAKALGMTIPQAVLARADGIIQ